MGDWSVRGTNETCPGGGSAARSHLIDRAPTAPGEMRFPAPHTALVPAAAPRPWINYSRPLDYVGDERAANNVLLSRNPWFNRTTLMTKR
jgi:hypothetical protein